MCVCYYNNLACLYYFIRFSNPWPLVLAQATAQMEEKLETFIENNATLDLAQESDAVLCFLHYQVSKETEADIDRGWGQDR